MEGRSGVIVFVLLSIGLVALVAGVSALNEPVTEPRSDAASTGPIGPMMAETTVSDGPITYTFQRPNHERFIVGGKHREGHLGSTSPHLFLDEALWVDVLIQNEGETTESYDVPLDVDGEVIDAASGHLDPGEQTVVTLGAQFGSPGLFELEVLEHSSFVTVHEEGGVVVTDFDGEGTGDTATLVATVLADDVPSEGTIEITRGVDEVIHSETVTLDATETTTVETTVDTPESEDSVGYWAQGKLVLVGADGSVTTPADIEETDSDFDDFEIDVDTDVDFDIDTDLDLDYDVDTDVDVDIDVDTDVDVDVETGEADATGDAGDADDEPGADDDGPGFGLLAVLASALLVTVFGRYRQ